MKQTGDSYSKLMGMSLQNGNGCRSGSSHMRRHGRIKLAGAKRRADPGVAPSDYHGLHDECPNEADKALETGEFGSLFRIIATLQR
jgi:hypothetical protein